MRRKADRLERALRGEETTDSDSSALASIAMSVRSAHQSDAPPEREAHARMALHRAITERRRAIATSERRPRSSGLLRLAPVMAAAAAVVAVAVVSPSALMTPVNAAGGLFSGSSSNGLKVEARLGAGASDPLASGKAKGELREDRTRFGVEVEDLSSAGAHSVVVTRAEAVVPGSEGLVVMVDALGFGDLNLDSRGDVVPAVQEGDLVEVISPGGVTILSGTRIAK
jgi:hypothetical protein